MTALQLSLDAADRLVESLGEAGGSLTVRAAAEQLLGRMRVPDALARAVVDGVVRDDDRLVWIGPQAVGLASWGRGPTPIEAASWCVVDLETTGLSSRRDRIVEIGAVRVEGLALAGTFERLVDPGVALPPVVARLTGLSSRDLVGRDRPAAAVPAFLRFAGDAVLVAHNARFDIGFLDAALERACGRRLACPVVDTVHLARRLLAGRAQRFSLGRLAAQLGTSVEPCHRALPDARATAEILLVLLGKAQERGARTVEDVLTLAAPPPARAAARAHLAVGAPEAPGTYAMKDASGSVVYVGSAADLSRRVRSYFRARPAAERAIDRALGEVASIEYARTGSSLEARLAEAAALVELRPRANRADVRSDRAVYVALDGDPARLRVVARPHGDRIVVGPLRSRRHVEQALEALRSLHGIRSCAAADPVEGACVEARLGRCLAPCRGAAERAAHAAAAARVAALLLDGGEVPVAALRARRDALAAQRRYEEAARLRDGERAVRRVGVGVARLRAARRAHGVLLAPHVDDRHVLALGIAHGLVAARRPLPRSGDATLEVSALVAALRAAVAAGPGTAGPLAVDAGRQAELRIVAAALRRPPVDVVAVPLPAVAAAESWERLATVIGFARSRVPTPVRVA